MCNGADKKYLPTPKWMKRKRRATIEVDSCCAKVLLHLWANRVDTLYHCCFHWQKKPLLVLATGRIKSIKEVRELIKQVDKRYWRISG